MNFNDVLQDFRRWLIDVAGLTVNSADQYKTYINKLRIAVNEDFGEGWFERMMVDDEEGFSGTKRMWCSALIEGTILRSVGEMKKRWQNWKSGFSQFEDFLDYGVSEAPEVERHVVEAASVTRETMPVEPIPTPQSHVREDVPSRRLEHGKLFDKFRNRLITQRRMYPNIHVDGAAYGLIFTPRLIRKVCGGGMDSAWSRWLRNGIETVRVLRSENGDSVPFSDVMRMDIYADCRVEVTNRDGDIFALMTKTHDRRIVTEQAVLLNRGETAPDWNAITIDHVIPLENVLRANVDRLDGFKRLSQLFSDFNIEHGGVLDGRKDCWVDDLYDRYHEELEDEALRNMIADDLLLIETSCGGYELMDSRENSKKGKNPSCRPVFP